MENISGSILKFLRLDNFVQHLTGYVETKIELMKVEIREDVTRAVARGLVIMVLFLVAFMFLIFFSVGLAHFINQYLGTAYAGYWTVAGIYAVTFLMLAVFRKNIHRYFEQ